MVKLKFIVRTGVLVLRISEGKERYYKRVAGLLKGTPGVKHWKADMEQFCGYAEFYKENNQILADYKQIYWKLVREHPELSARQVACFYRHDTSNRISKPVVLSDWSVEEYKNSVSRFLEVVILREKAKQGCNFECYQKLLAKCRKSIGGFDELPFSTIDYNKMVAIAYSFAQDKGYRNYAKTFRALLGKAHKDPNVLFMLRQIDGFQFSDYDPCKFQVEMAHPDILSTEQLRTFLNADPYYLTPGYKRRNEIELYYDFCVFMYSSFFAPCDVIKAKLRDITNKSTLVMRRKKTHRPVEIPISPAMRKIIDKYRGQSKDGYIFPIMDDKKEKQYKTKDYSFKRFRGKLNVWLKSVGETLGTDFDLYAYVFRHTAITVAINSGLPVSYIAHAAGTSVEVIQQHYYNGECEQNRERLTEALMGAAV